MLQRAVVAAREDVLRRAVDEAHRLPRDAGAPRVGGDGVLACVPPMMTDVARAVAAQEVLLIGVQERLGALGGRRRRRLRRRRPHLISAELLERRVRVREPVRRVARAADLVLVLEGGLRVLDRRRRLEVGEAIALVRELPPDELELEVQRVMVLSHHARVPGDVRVRRRVPARAGGPLRDAAPGAVVEPARSSGPCPTPGRGSRRCRRTARA